MRLDLVTPAQVWIALSRRNLLTLLAKLEGHPPASACTITFPGTSEEPALVVTGEPDDVHYGQRAAPPGPIYPATEAWVRERDRRGRPS